MKVTASSYRRMPEALWRQLLGWLPKPRAHSKGGRPPLDPRRVADGIYYVLRTGCPWKAAPREYGSGSSLHRYFQQWTARGVFRKLWKQGLQQYDRRRGIGWRWQSLDTALNKAPLGGEKNREKPHRSRQAGRQTFGADRRPRRGAGLGDWSGQSTRPETGGRHAAKRARWSAATGAATTTTLVRRQGVPGRRVRSVAAEAALRAAHQVAR